MKRTVSFMLALLPLAAGCASSGGVTRMAGGHRIEGRFVSDQAYAAYMNGVVWETAGQVDRALAAYGEAIARDSESAELWTRVGVLRCTDSRSARAPAKTGGPWEAFERAAKIDPEYEETWTERARCHLKRSELDGAAHAARIAVALDPNRTEPVILLAQVLERQTKTDEARRWLDGLVVREPGSIDAHEAMVGFAARTQDEARRFAAEQTLIALRGPPPRDRRPPQLAEVDTALVGGHFDRAERLALAARVSSGALALRAVALGIANFARAEAEIVLSADPTDSDARTAAAVAADLMRDEAALARAMSDIPAHTTPLSPLATVLMAELLARRVGRAAESAWGGGRESGSGGDELVERVVRRMKGTGGGEAR